MTAILVCDDHPIFREGLKKILQAAGDIAVAGEAGSGKELLEQLGRRRFDAVVLDLSLPDRDGLDLLRSLRDSGDRTPVLILSTHPEDQYAVRTLKAGASGYLEKAAVPSELPVAVRKVASGGRYVSPAVAERLAFELDGSHRGASHEALSDREYQVLRMLASGMGTQRISGKLCLSPATVSTYRTRLMRKLGLKSTAEIIRYAIENRIEES